MASLASNSYAKVDESIRLRGKRLRSRVYLPAHQPGLAADGLPGDRYVEYHRRRARAGLGMQITGAHLGKHAPKPRRSSATNNHGSTARVERADNSVEVLSRGPKSAVEAQNEVASILRYRLG